MSEHNQLTNEELGKEQFESIMPEYAERAGQFTDHLYTIPRPPHAQINGKSPLDTLLLMTRANKFVGQNDDLEYAEILASHFKMAIDQFWADLDTHARVIVTLTDFPDQESKAIALINIVKLASGWGGFLSNPDTTQLEDAYKNTEQQDELLGIITAQLEEPIDTSALSNFNETPSFVFIFDTRSATQ